MKMLAQSVALMLWTCFGIISSFDLYWISSRRNYVLFGEMDIRRPVDVPNPAFRVDNVEPFKYRPMSLLDAVQEDPFVRYSDETKRFTAIKDSNYGACFITNYDPEWMISVSERQVIVDTKEARIIRTPPQFTNFKETVGDVIAAMCKKSKLYWIVSSVPVRANQNGGGVGPPGQPSENIRTNVLPLRKLPAAPRQDSMRSGGSPIKTPPPLVRPGNVPIRTPPPLHAIKNIRTPPPLPNMHARMGVEPQNVALPGMRPHSLKSGSTYDDKSGHGPQYAVPHRLASRIVPELVNVLPNLPKDNTRSRNYPVPVRNEHVIVPFKVNK